ncbi:MAG: MmgE/PrpD family protein [Bacilli bacterium]|nr:MmgE/PrpD family protein [Bacilli bacterium]
MTISEKLAAITTTFDYEQIPDDVIREAKYHLLDAIGVMIAASREEGSQQILNTALELGKGESCTATGSSSKLPPHLAALVNGTYLHSLEYDDTHTDSIIHPSCVVVPTTLAVGETLGSNGKEVLQALLLGWESLIRFGLAAPNRFQSRGFHTTAVCGAFSSVLISGLLTKMDEQAITSALGIAGSQASGIFEYVTDGATVKQTHPGWAAHNGIVAAKMAAHGIQGPRTVFEGRFGFYNTFAGADQYELDTVWKTLGKQWLSTELSYKPYPCCHFNHAFVDCAKTWLQDNINIAELEQIICHINPEVVAIVCEPWEKKMQPRTGYEAKFSLPYAVASALLDGNVTLDTYREQAIRREGVKELMGKISYVTETDTNYPESFPGWIEFRMKNSSVKHVKLKYNRGGPKNPLDSKEIEMKFLDNATRLLSESQSEELRHLILNIEEFNDIRKLTKLLV